MKHLTVPTHGREGFVDITGEIRTAVAESGMTRGACLVFCPHTTAGLTINENADPDVRRDLLTILERVVPQRGDYHHAEGNSAAHAKASMFGSSVLVAVEDGAPVLGTWQSVFFCEFDGPRRRSVWLQMLPG